MSKHDKISEFQLEGRFLGFTIADGYKLKLLRLSTAAGEYQIKLPKEMRSQLYRMLSAGEWIQVSGYQKSDLRKGTTKLKAEQIVPISPRSADWKPETPPVAPAQTPASEPAKATKPATILVCQKSDCCKRGANRMIQTLQSELADRGLSDQVKIRGTGCMKHCKAGPNLVMPDKSRYSRIRPSEVPSLLDKHFPDAETVTS